jgi:YesN/AraC family two-component response regulator
LERIGYSIITALDGEQSYSLAQSQTPDLILMAGFRQKLTPIRPEMRVVYMSGYTGFRHGQGPEAHTNLLPKPFNRETLLRKLQDALALDEHLS